MDIYDDESQGNGEGTGSGAESGVDSLNKSAFAVEKKQKQKMIFENFKWLNSYEAATYLRVSVGQIRNMVYRGQLKCYHISNRLRFLKSDLDNIVSASYFVK